MEAGQVCSANIGSLALYPDVGLWLQDIWRVQAGNGDIQNRTALRLKNQLRPAPAAEFSQPPLRRLVGLRFPLNDPEVTLLRHSVVRLLAAESEVKEINVSILTSQPVFKKLRAV